MYYYIEVHIDIDGTTFSFRDEGPGWEELDKADEFRDKVEASLFAGQISHPTWKVVVVADSIDENGVYHKEVRTT